jgi:hypothetical protein
MKCFLSFFLSTILSTVAYADAAQHTLEVGNRVEQKSSAKGPGNVKLQIQNCKISLNLEIKDHLWFNEPDAIFFRSKSKLNTREKPFLWQAKTNSGYNWQFRKPGRTDDIWLGFMCASSDEFDWNADLARADSKDTAAPIELALIKEANKFKCPASKISGAWKIDGRTSSVDDYKLVEVNGRNWNGFIFGVQNKKDATYKEIRVCLIHGDEVLLGFASDDTKKLRLPADALDTYVKIISSINFVD